MKQILKKVFNKNLLPLMGGAAIILITLSAILGFGYSIYLLGLTNPQIFWGVGYLFSVLIGSFILAVIAQLTD